LAIAYLFDRERPFVLCCGATTGWVGSTTDRVGATDGLGATTDGVAAAKRWA